MLLTSDLRHAGFTPARATCCQGTPLRLSPRFPLALSPAPFSSLLSPCWGHPKLSSCSGLEWGKSVEILLFGFVLAWFWWFFFFPVKCDSCSLVILFSVYPLLDPSPLSPIPALHSCTKMPVKLQEQPPPGAWSGPEGTSLVPAPMLRRSLLAAARTGWHRGRLEPTCTRHRGL